MSRGNEKILQATLQLNLSKRILVRLSVVLTITFRFSQVKYLIKLVGRFIYVLMLM